MTKTETHTNKTILRVLLAGVAVLILCGAAVGAVGAEGSPYQIGDKYADTLYQAYYKAADGDTIKVLTDVTESEEQWLSSSNKSVTLDLNGKTISAGKSTEYFIFWGSTGTLTITDTTEEKKGTLSGGNKTQVLRISSGTVEMTAGTITGGNANEGGGVCVNMGTFTMSGSASVTGNTATNGGGVYVNGGEFTMSGSASVTGNTAKSNGGGVYNVYVFTMSDSASVTDNTATEGGGVYVYYGEFTMNGGTIGGSAAADANTANNNGGGVYVAENGRFNVSGAPDISGNTDKATTPAANNVYLFSQKTITVTAPLTGGQIWIQSPLSTESPYNNFATGVGGSESYTVKSTDAQYFHPDDETELLKAAVTSSDKETYEKSTLGWVEAEKVAKIKDGNEYTSVQAAVKAATAGDTIIMIADSTEPTVLVNKEVTLDLAGHVLKNKNGGSVIKVTTSGNLTVIDENPSGTPAATEHYFKVQASGKPWILSDNSSAAEKDAAVLIGNITDISQLSEGTLIKVTGGCITGGEITDGNNGAGVFMETTGDPDYKAGTFSMTGGNIIGNSSNGNGGGAETQGTASFTRVTIAGNSANGGGGLDGCGTVTLSDSRIIGNNATGWGVGGGVASWYELTMTGSSSIICNSSSGDGSGVYAGGGTLKVKDAPVIKGNMKGTGSSAAADNVYLSKADMLKLTAPLTGGEIRITDVSGVKLEIGAQFGTAEKSELAGAEHFVADVAEGADPLVGSIVSDAEGNMLVWKEGKATVTFDMQDHGAAIEAQVLEPGSKVTKPADPTAAGYTFGGWYTDSGCTAGKEWNFDTSVSSSVTLFAKWTAVISTYTITFNGNGGSVTPSTITAKYGTQVDLSSKVTVTPPTADCTHSGWALSSKGPAVYAAGQSVKDLGNITLYAVWTPAAKQHNLTVNVTHGSTAVPGAAVKLKQGNVDVSIIPTESPVGTYTFSHVPEGVYTIEVSNAGKTKTKAVTISGEGTVVDINLPEKNVNSVVDVKSESGTPAVAVEGADKEAESSTEESVTITVTVEAKTDGSTPETQAEIDKIKEEVKKTAPADSELAYLDITVTKKVNQTATKLYSTANVLEFIIPYDNSDKTKVIKLYRCHKGETGEMQTNELTKLSAEPGTKEDGKYWLDEEHGLIHLYATLFSTYCVGYSDASKPSKSSSSQGSSTWLTEPAAQPTVTPTPTPTPGAAETPSVKPVTPTETPAKTPAPFLGILAGLGAAAVVFGLRRK